LGVASRSRVYLSLKLLCGRHGGPETINNTAEVNCREASRVSYFVAGRVNLLAWTGAETARSQPFMQEDCPFIHEPSR
jgi:hypothetical protein